VPQVPVAESSWISQIGLMQDWQSYNDSEFSAYIAGIIGV